MNEKEFIIKSLEHTYCRLGVSKTHGVGIIAIREIPKGIDPFFVRKNQKWIKFSEKEFSHLDDEVKRIIEDFYVKEKDGSIFINEHAFCESSMQIYINHSNNPTMETFDNGETFITKRTVKKGEELTVDYKTFEPNFNNFKKR
jgi:hypothetical protein